MPSDEELTALVAELESDRTERKQSGSDSDEIAKAICAFANDMPRHGRPGYVFVGVKNDGTPAGIEIDDRLLLNLGALRDDGRILPSPRMTVQKRRLLGHDVAVVEVFPADLPPVRFRGVVWIRVGPRKAVANEAEERALAERRAAYASRTWDALPHEGAVITDLAIDLFHDYRTHAVARSVIDENHRSEVDQLASLRFVDRGTGRPTNAGVVCFGKDVRYFFDGAYVQVVWYQGVSSATEVLKEREITGDLASVLRRLDELAKDVAAARPRAVSELREVTVYDYPPEALREAWVNAVVHRDYASHTPVMINFFSDRIEVQNPGGLYGDASAADFPGVTAYRNPILAEAAKVLGYVNRFGRGIPRIQASLAKNGSPPAQFDVRGRHFLVTLRKPS